MSEERPKSGRAEREQDRTQNAKHERREIRSPREATGNRSNPKSKYNQKDENNPKSRFHPKDKYKEERFRDKHDNERPRDGYRDKRPQEKYRDEKSREYRHKDDKPRSGFGNREKSGKSGGQAKNREDGKRNNDNMVREKTDDVDSKGTVKGATDVSKEKRDGENVSVSNRSIETNIPVSEPKNEQKEVISDTSKDIDITGKGKESVKEANQVLKAKDSEKSGKSGFGRPTKKAYDDRNSKATKDTIRDMDNEHGTYRDTRNHSNCTDRKHDRRDDRDRDGKHNSSRSRDGYTESERKYERYSDRNHSGHDRDRRDNHFDQDRRDTNSDRDRRDNHSDRDRRDNHSDRDRRDNHSDRDRRDNYSDRDRRDNHSDRDRRDNHSDRDRRDNHSDRDRRDNHSDRDRRDNHSDRGRRGFGRPSSSRKGESEGTHDSESTDKHQRSDNDLKTHSKSKHDRDLESDYKEKGFDKGSRLNELQECNTVGVDNPRKQERKGFGKPHSDKKEVDDKHQAKFDRGTFNDEDRDRNDKAGNQGMHRGRGRGQRGGREERSRESHIGGQNNKSTYQSKSESAKGVINGKTNEGEHLHYRDTGSKKDFLKESSTEKGKSVPPGFEKANICDSTGASTTGVKPPPGFS